MSFSWRTLLGVALSLLGQSAGEALHRSAINRAYYGAFGEAVKFAISHGYVPHAGQSSHVQVWKYLQIGSGLPPALKARWKVVGDAGFDLKRLRTHADYRALPASSQVDARRAISIADRIIKQLDQLP